LVPGEVWLPAPPSAPNAAPGGPPLGSDVSVNAFGRFLGNQGDQEQVLRQRVEKAKKDYEDEVQKAQQFKSTDVVDKARDAEKQKVDELRVAYEKLNGQVKALEEHKRGQSELRSFLDGLAIREESGPVAKIYAKRDELVKKGAVLNSADYATLTGAVDFELDKQQKALDKQTEKILNEGYKLEGKDKDLRQFRAMALLAGMPADQVNSDHFEEDMARGLERRNKDIVEKAKKVTEANREIGGINLDEGRSRIEDQSRRTLRNLEPGSPVGQIEQRNVIEESYRVRLDLADKLKQKEDERIASEADAATAAGQSEKRRIDERRAKFDYDKLVWQAEDEHEDKLLEMQHKRIEESRAVAGKVFDALDQGHGALQKLIHDELTSVERQIFVNATSGIFNQAGGAIGRAMPQGGAWSKIFKGTLLEGTGGSGSTGSPEVLSRDANTRSIDRLTSTIEKGGPGGSGSGSGEGTVLSPGALVPGMVGVTFSDLISFTQSQIGKPTSPASQGPGPAQSASGSGLSTWLGLAGLGAAGINQMVNPPGFPGPKLITPAAA
jgi:hypothetical protein